MVLLLEDKQTKKSQYADLLFYPLHNLLVKILFGHT